MGQSFARALSYTAPGKAELRSEPLKTPLADEITVRSLYSGVSRGTERLISAGAAGASEYERMRCPLQAGDFPFPVKYGYCAVGTVEQGDESLAGCTVFIMHPHQDIFTAPAAMAFPIPEGVPPRRATLAANMETALNAVWDGAPGPADRIAVVGGGLVGLLVAYLCARLPGAEVTVVDIDATRAKLAHTVGARFATPGGAPIGMTFTFGAKK